MLILVVEDEAIIGMAIAIELLDAGHQVLGPVASIEQARLLAVQGHPDLALIDVDVERRGDGIDFARTLLATPAVASLFITARPAFARAHPALALGVIAKPFMSTDIARCVAVAQTIMDGGVPLPAEIPPRLELFEPLH